MRVVFDTSVLVSALLWPDRLPDRAVGAARRGRVLSVTSPVLLEEFRRVLFEKLGFEEAASEAAVETVASHSEMVIPKTALHVVQADPEDDRVLEFASEGKADAVVTGDRRLLALKEYEGMAIVSPKDFLERLESC